MIKTSATHPLRVDFVAHPTLGSRGALGMTLAPGKRARSAFGGRWERDLDADLARLAQEHGANVLVSMMEKDETSRLGIHGYGAAARRHGLRLLRRPVPDGGIPTLRAMARLAGEIDSCLDRGERVVVHCRGGLGRTGTAAACVLARRGLSADAAIRAVRAARPGTIENVKQEDFVRRFAARSQGGDVSAWLRRLRLGQPSRLGGREIVPLFWEAQVADPGYLLADEAIANGGLEVRESGEGVVQALTARNRGRVPVLLLEGDTLIGCKQNRVVNHTVLLGSNATRVVPVGCMEQNRWSFVSNQFRSGDTRVEPAVRRETLRERVSGLSGRQFDQGRLWQQVDERLKGSGVVSSTSDYGSYLQTRSGQLGASVKELTELPGQVGALVVQGKRLVVLEAACHPRLWSALSKRTLVSYLLGEAGSQGAESNDAPGTWLARIVGGRVASSPGIGLGWDFTVCGEDFVGSGLCRRGVLAHVAVFGTD